jgi:hypothetical protein
LKLLVDEDGTFSDADTVHGTYNSANSSFIVRNHFFQHGYYYTLGTEENIVSTKSGRRKLIPIRFQLYQNYPNPFNSLTKIEFQIPKNEYVTLKIFNLLGEEVETLLSASLLAGSHSCEWDATVMASGVYLCQLRAGEFVQTRKLILLR